MELTRSLIHYGGHFLVPLAFAFLFYRKQWKKQYLILLATMVVDLDHLLADPIFDPCRCSIGYHPLHSYYATLIYFFLLFPKVSRWVALGLFWHMVVDFIDCMTIHWVC